jgi:nucleotide-binding universal stress UspA family protein
MKRILLATDFSKAASNAASYAAALAAELKANLILLHVFQIPTTYSELPITVNVDEMSRSAEEGMLKLKNDLVQKTKNEIQIETQVTEGVFFQALNIACEEANPFLVIIGTQGTASTERLLFGSDAVYTMKHLEFPIIAVPVDYTYEPIRKIGFACDLEHIEDIPVEKMKIFIDEFSAEFHVLNAAKKETHTLNPENRSTVLFARLADLKPEYHFIQDEDIDEGTMEFAEKNGMDLLILLPKKHTFLSNLILSSHTREIVLQSHVPVLALHN